MQQNTITKHYSREQLAQMSPDDLIDIIKEAGPNATFKGTAVVRRADGTIKYDTDAVPGNFNEAPGDLK